MKTLWRITAALLASTLVASACGSDEPVGLERLDGVLEDSATLTSYRVGLSTGQQVSVPGLGLDIDTRVDPANPELIGVVVDGQANFALNIASLFGLDSATEKSAILELWTNDDQLVVDASRLEDFEASNAEADLGPLAPGLFELDREQLSAADLTQSLLGVGAIDLPSVVGELAPVLRGLNAESVVEEVYTGWVSYDVFIEALGGDVERSAHSAAVALALSVPVDPEGLADAFVEAYANTRTDVAIEVVDGAVRVVSFQTDLTQAYAHLLQVNAFGDLGLSMSQVRETENLFTDGFWVLDARAEFVPDDSIELGEFPEPDEDRTEAWLEFLGATPT